MSKEKSKDKATVSMHFVDTGRYKAEVYKKDKETGELVLQRSTAWSDNIITDDALDAMASGTSLTSAGNIQVGTGTTPETASDTSLESPGPSEGSASTQTGTTYPTSPYYAYRRFTYNYDEGAAEGTWTEVGKWSGAVGSSVFTSRSLFKDELGNPTSITVLADEILRIVYEARRYAPETDVEVTVDGYDLTIRAADVDSNNSWSALARLPNSSTQARLYTGTIGAINARPSGSAYTASTSSTQTYVPGSFESVVDWSWNTSKANDTLQSLVIGFVASSTSFQIGFDPAIVKTSDDVLEITSKMTLGRPA